MNSRRCAASAFFGGRSVSDPDPIGLGVGAMGHHSPAAGDGASAGSDIAADSAQFDALWADAVADDSRSHGLSVGAALQDLVVLGMKNQTVTAASGSAAATKDDVCAASSAQAVSDHARYRDAAAGVGMRHVSCPEGRSRPSLLESMGFAIVDDEVLCQCADQPAAAPAGTPFSR